MKRIAAIEDKFSGAFARDWEFTLGELTAVGIVIGAYVRNKDGELFRLTNIDPHVYLGGDPLASVSCHGNKFRSDGTFGTHKHWVGRTADLTVE
jgi:hypothetical protein